MIDSIPVRLKMQYPMKNVNSFISLFSGLAILKQNESSYTFFVKIYHKWFPSAGLYADIGSISNNYKVGKAELAVQGRT